MSDISNISSARSSQVSNASRAPEPAEIPAQRRSAWGTAGRVLLAVATVGLSELGLWIFRKVTAAPAEGRASSVLFQTITNDRSVTSSQGSLADRPSEAGERSSAVGSEDGVPVVIDVDVPMGEEKAALLRQLTTPGIAPEMRIGNKHMRRIALEDVLLLAAQRVGQNRNLKSSEQLALSRDVNTYKREIAAGFEDYHKSFLGDWATGGSHPDSNLPDGFGKSLRDELVDQVARAMEINIALR